MLSFHSSILTGPCSVPFSLFSLQVELDDNLLNLQAMAGSRFVGAFSASVSVSQQLPRSLLLSAGSGRPSSVPSAIAAIERAAYPTPCTIA